MKRKQRALVAMFLIMLVAPTLLFQLLKGSIDTENHENRPLVSFYDVTQAPFEKWPLVFQEYYTDHLPFKNQFVALNSLISLTLFRTTASPLVVVGEDNWLFFNNIGLDNPIDDVTGVTTFSQEEIDKIGGNVQKCKQELSEQDIELYVMIAPNKEAVYSEFLPDYIQNRMVSQSRTDILAQSLLPSEPNFFYPKNALLNAKASYQTYYKYDTHWNNIGAFIAASEILERIGIPLQKLDDYSIGEEYPAPCDLADLASLSSFCRDDAIYTLSEFGAGVSWHKEDLFRGAMRYTSTAADSRRIVIFGDSYSDALVQYFYLTFGEVVVINKNVAEYNKDDIIKEYQPDIVILELVERGSSMLLHDDILA